MARERLGAIQLHKMIPDIAGRVPKDGSTAWLAAIAGVAYGVARRGETQYGPWVSFAGRFKAVNLDTGEFALGSELFLPAIAEQTLIAALQLDEADKSTVQGIEFVYQIGVRKGDKQAYNYVIDSLQPELENDPLAHLTKMLPVVEPKTNVAQIAGDATKTSKKKSA